MEVIKSDVTIVGAGIAGLWSAKELIDQGLSVCIAEKSETLANGATTRNEGWLHAGTYHSVAVEDEEDALRVTERTLYGHESILSFAPESIDHDQSFALIATNALAHKAIERWDKAGVEYRAVSTGSFRESEGIETERIQAAFEVKDKSVNSMTLCQKLARYIIHSGGRIITNANFRPVSDTTADLCVGNNDRYAVHSDQFLLTAGTGIKELVENVTGKELFIRYFQAHLLVTPRLTRDNYFYLDVGEAGIMSHGRTSIVGINRDGIELREPSYSIVPDKEQLLFQAMVRMLPDATKKVNAKSMTVACCKPDIYKSREDTQSLNIQVFEPASNYVCALPGKMTESPYLGKEAAEYVVRGSQHKKIVPTPIQQTIPDVTLRPADEWMRQIPEGDA